MTGGMLNDVVYDAYLANDRTLDDPEIVTVEKGGTIRLRIINGAAASNMWIDLGALEGELDRGRRQRHPSAEGQGLPAGHRPARRYPHPHSRRKAAHSPCCSGPEGLPQRTGIVLATAGAAVARVAGEGDTAPALDLSQELLYRAVAKPREEPVTRTEMLMLTGGGRGLRLGPQRQGLDA